MGKLSIGIFGLIIVALAGCMAFQKSLTPTYIPEECIEYSEVDVPVLMPYTTLVDAELVDAGMTLRHEIGELEYAAMKGNLMFHIQNAEELQGAIFDPQGGLISILLAGSGLGIGAMAISKPGDKKKIKELENGNSHS